jgi:hypothetical protein
VGIKIALTLEKIIEDYKQQAANMTARHRIPSTPQIHSFSDMVKITRNAKRPATEKASLLRLLYSCLLAGTAFALMFVFASFSPLPPMERPPSQQLATINNTRVTTDVRGNLGPPEVMVQEGSDWLKDRWQAASDMHGTAIQGVHEVLLSFHFPIELEKMELDWEAAYSKDYLIEGALSNLIWFTLYDTASDDPSTNLLQMGPVREEGQSPGVKSKTPLHVIHPFFLPSKNNQTQTTTTTKYPKLQYLKLTIRSSAMGWCVSLWRIKLFGWPTFAPSLLRTKI